MSSLAAKKPYTAEEFLLLPDPANGDQMELVRGEIVTLTPSGGMQGVCCSKADRRIGNYVEAHNLGVVTANDTGFITVRDPDSVRGPDVPPDLAVEVLSPSHSSRQIRVNLQEYFARGVCMAWIIASEDRTLTIYRTPDERRLLYETATVTGEDVLPGFECRVADFMG